MKKRIAVITENMYLYQKIKLDAPSETTVYLGGEDADLILFDLDTAGGNPPEGALTMSRYKECDISLPLPLGLIGKLAREDGERTLTLNSADRTARLRGEGIKLTEVEFALLALLYSKEGGFVSREEILDSVWSGDADAGVINVYVHYLREKLEAGGEKIIISSRKCGYKIDEKYFKESEKC